MCIKFGSSIPKAIGDIRGQKLMFSDFWYLYLQTWSYTLVIQARLESTVVNDIVQAAENENLRQQYNTIAQPMGAVSAVTEDELHQRSYLPQICIIVDKVGLV